MDKSMPDTLEYILDVFSFIGCLCLQIKSDRVHAGECRHPIESLLNTLMHSGYKCYRKKNHFFNPFETICVNLYN